MKKAAMFSCFLAFCFAVTAFAATDVQSEINRCQEKKAATNSKYDGMMLDAWTAIGQKMPENYEQLRMAFVVAAKKNYADNEQAEKIGSIASSAIARWKFDGKFLKELGDYSKVKPNFVDGRSLYLYDDARLGISENERYDAIVANLLNPKYDAQSMLKFYDAFSKLSISKKPDEVKILLQKFNRIYSPKLITNKTQWEPLVASIRTSLETY